MQELTTARPKQVGEIFRRPRAVRLVVVGDHQHSHAGLGDIGVGEPAEHGDREDPGLTLDLGGAPHDRLHRLAEGRGVPQRRQQQRLFHRRFRTHLAPCRRQEELRRAQAGLIAVHVGIGLAADHDVGVAQHLLAEVGVIVQADGDGDVRSDALADALQHVAFAVVDAFHHHRSVQGQNHSVGSGAQAVQDDGLGPLVEIGLDHARGGGMRGNSIDQLDSVAGGEIDESPHVGARARQSPLHLIAGVELNRLELGSAGEDVAEGVGLVKQLRREPFHPVLLSPGSLESDRAGSARHGAGRHFCGESYRSTGPTTSIDRAWSLRITPAGESVCPTGR